MWRTSRRFGEGTASLHLCATYRGTPHNLYGSSWNRVGDFWGSMVEKAVHCLGILHYGWTWNLASMMDGTSSEAEPAALGYVLVPWFSTETNGARDFR